MPLQGILSTARTLSFYARKQEVTANNLANANSDGFKADRVLAHGFFTVQTADGVRLTRGGSFRLDAGGRLADANGGLLLGEGGPIVAEGGKLEVQQDGTVKVDGAIAGRLRIVDVGEPGQLHKEGYGRYATTGELTGADEDLTRVRQGAVEDANIDPMLSMVDLVTIQRAFAANVDALKAMDSVLGAVTNEVGKVG